MRRRSEEKKEKNIHHLNVVFAATFNFLVKMVRVLTHLLAS